MTAAPTRSEPVNVTRSILGSVVKRSPISTPPVITLRTPGGSPASAATSPSKSASSGVNGDGFRTIVQPETSAGPSFTRFRKKGKLNGVIAATTPAGSRTFTVMPSVFLPLQSGMTRGGRGTIGFRRAAKSTAGLENLRDAANLYETAGDSLV